MYIIDRSRVGVNVQIGIGHGSLSFILPFPPRLPTHSNVKEFTAKSDEYSV